MSKTIINLAAKYVLIVICLSPYVVEARGFTHNNLGLLPSWMTWLLLIPIVALVLIPLATIPELWKEGKYLRMLLLSGFCWSLAFWMLAKLNWNIFIYLGFGILTLLLIGFALSTVLKFLSWLLRLL